MRLITSRNRLILAAALFIPFAGSVWLLASRNAMAGSTFASLAALLIAVAAIGLNTWKNGQAAGSVGQLIYEADVAPATVSPRGGTDARRC